MKQEMEGWDCSRQCSFMMWSGLLIKFNLARVLMFCSSRYSGQDLSSQRVHKCHLSPDYLLRFQKKPHNPSLFYSLG